MLDKKEALRRLILNSEPEEIAEALAECLNEEVTVVWDKAVRIGLDQLRRGTIVSVIKEATEENPQLLAMAQLFTKSKKRLQERQGRNPERSSG